MTTSNAPKSRSVVELPADLKSMQAIGSALRAYYDDLLHAPLPARFEELLSQLDGTEQVEDRGPQKPTGNREG